MRTVVCVNWVAKEVIRDQWKKIYGRPESNYVLKKVVVDDYDKLVYV